TMLRRFAHAIVSIPTVYDRVQALAGQGKIAGRVREAIASLPRGRILDVGSAGGRLADRLGVVPVFADIDLAPLAARRRRGGPAPANGGNHHGSPAGKFQLERGRTLLRLPSVHDLRRPPAFLSVKRAKPPVSVELEWASPWA